MGKSQEIYFCGTIKKIVKMIRRRTIFALPLFYKPLCRRKKLVGSIRRIIIIMLPQFQLWDRKYFILPKGSINPYLAERKVLG